MNKAVNAVSGDKANNGAKRHRLRKQDGWTLNILQHCRQISVCSLPEVLTDQQRLSILCREDQMGEEVRQGLRHDIRTSLAYVIVTHFQR